MCRCNCGWPVYTKKPATVVCPQCSAQINCLGGSTPAEPPEPQPSHKWPTWAVAIARFAKPHDTGVGDTAQRIAAAFGGEFFKTFASSIGMPCGCTQRQKEWNTRYPYSKCVVCGALATTICSHTLSLGMCGAPLCKDCKHPHIL